MEFYKHTELNKLQIPPSPIVYFQKSYLEVQQYDDIKLFQNEDLLIPFSIRSHHATSLERSPFGSFLKSHADASIQTSFQKQIEKELRKDHVEQLTVKQPSSIYSDFVDSADLTKVGYDLIYNDVNQHIVLSQNWENTLHTMQTRKLKSLAEDGFAFKKIADTELELVHQFLVVCRQAQGLQINISLDKLQQLHQLLPGTYELFGIYREEKLSAVCITVNVSKDIAYYYLAGTSPLFRSQSPMVLLIAGMVEYYRSKGFKYFDLGISSMQGKPQETLRIFKQRMGAEETVKPTFIKSL